VKSITIYSDGACEGNPGPGGWAAVLQYGDIQKEIAGAEPATTNNRMELTAAIQALQKLKEPCAVAFHSDSEYVINGITNWIFAWKKKNWMKGTKPIKNADLWRQLHAATAPHKITWTWVKGHSNNPLNERCDRLAVEEIANLRKSTTRESLKQALADFKAAHASEAPADTPTLI
jgi:ribonuclease HI